MSDLGLLKERAKYKKLCREAEALYVAIQMSTVESKMAVQKATTETDTLKKSELRRRIHTLELRISKIREEFGAKVPNSVFVELLGKASAAPSKYLMVPKFFMAEYFSHYEKVFSDFGLLPEHANIGIHDGTEREAVGPVEVYLLEAKLFEDMCALFNQAKELVGNDGTNKQGKSKVYHKKLGALCRGTVTSAFYFVESYLNGIAYDHYVTHKGTLDDKTKQILLEWDMQKKVPRYLSLREKLLQFPKIILGRPHPPLQENNCAEAEFLLERVKVLRDGIAHPTPGPNLTKTEPGKEGELFNTDFEEVESIVDNSVALVRKIEKMFQGNELRLYWLHNRSSDGTFPDIVFE